MDEIKSKVFSFVKKQGAIHGIEVGKDVPVDNSEEIRNSAVVRSKPPDETIDEIEDDEVLQQLPKYYFDDTPQFDIQYHLLKGLAENIKCQDIKLQLRTLYRQHGVVSKKTWRQILEKETLCKEELERIGEIQNELEVALAVCRGSRLQLNSAKGSFTTKSLGLLRDFRRKQTITLLLLNLRTIRTLQKGDERLQKLLKEGDFSGAIRLLLESQRVAASLKHFKCVVQLSEKLQNTLESTEGQLDEVLCQMCHSFDEVAYTKLQEAYSLLDKTQIAMDQLLMHFTSELHTTVFKVVHKFASPGATTKQFVQLCKSVPSKDYVACLKKMCQEIWKIVNSFNKVRQWHQQQDRIATTKSNIPGREFEKGLSKQYVKQKLENGQTRLWTDCQARVSAYISDHDFADCKFDDLLQILANLHRLMEIGEEFCGSSSDEISKCIRQQTACYFQNFHAATLEELRIFLENETWTPCPVKPKFNLTHLQELKGIRHSIETHRKPRRSNLESSSKDSETHNSCSNLSTGGSSSQTLNYFARFADNATPFDAPLDDAYGQEDILENVGEDLSGYYSVSSEESDNEELKKTYVDEHPQQETVSDVRARKKRDKAARRDKPAPPLLANTTLTVLRHCGKYLQMCRLLKPIALDVIICMCQLFDYYLYSVYTFFTSDLAIQSSAMVTFKLQTALKRIEDNLILKNPDEVSQDNRRRIAACRISEMVDLSCKSSLYGLAERIVGVESLVFLGSQFEYIQPFVLHLVPDEKRHFIDHFYSQTVACVSDLRRAAYMCVSVHVVDMKQMIKDISAVKFDVKEISSQHSPYIDKIVKDMQTFAGELEEFEMDIPKEAELVLWENVIHVVNNILIEGFSSARKCSNGGRGLMLLDYTQLSSRVLKLTPLKKVPNKEYVENYVKAFYLQENILEEWITQHTEYTPKQLESLVRCACPNSKKTKQRLLDLLNIGKLNTSN